MSKLRNILRIKNIRNRYIKQFLSHKTFTKAYKQRE